ncbi:NAD(P)-dependent oxidoreductase [Xylanimonas ulmi]
MQNPHTTPTDAARGVGFIGLGSMGLPMAKNLVTASPAGTVHLMTFAPGDVQPLIDAGAVYHATAREVAQECDLVVLMVPDLPDVVATLDGPDGLLAGRRGRLVVAVSSSVSPAGLRALARRLDEESDGQVRVIDAPVSGGTEGAEAGTLAIMIGGEESDVARALPVYEAMGTPVRLGPIGAGQVAKACNQIIVAATMTALAEAVVLAERSGLDIARLLDLLQQGFAGSRLLDVKKDRLIRHDHSPSGAARFMVKDLAGMLAQARSVGAPTPMTEAAHRLFCDLTAQGLGDQDLSVVQAYLDSHVTPTIEGAPA